MRRHTYRILAATTSAFAIAGMLAAPAAWAQDTTGPDSEACQQAEQDVAALEMQVGIFTNGSDNGIVALADIQAAVASAIAADNEAELAEDSDATTAAKEALTAREGLVADVQAKLDAAVTVEGEACAEPVVEETETPEVTEQPEVTETPESTEQPGTGTDPADVPAVTGDDEQTTSAADDDAVLYENCAAVRDAGKAPLFATDDGYRPELDSDGDGVACETSILYNPSDNGETDGDYSQTGEVPVGSAETGQA